MHQSTDHDSTIAHRLVSGEGLKYLWDDPIDDRVLFTLRLRKDGELFARSLWGKYLPSRTEVFAIVVLVA